jgi:hypothetical protein
MISAFYSRWLLLILTIFSIVDNYLVSTSEISSIPTFTFASLILNETKTRTPFDFTITFRAIDVNFTVNYPTAILLPRFTRNLQSTNVTARNISYSDLIISPSTIFEAQFIDGYHQYSDIHTSYSRLPYISSMIIIRPRNGYTIKENSTVSVKIFKENGIGAICGFPSSSNHNSSKGYIYDPKLFSIVSLNLDVFASNITETIYNYTFDSGGSLLFFGQEEQNTTVFRNVTYFVNNSRVLDFYPGVGKGCNKDCLLHGKCDYCYETCHCFEGYGSANDIISIGSSVNQDCSSRKELKWCFAFIFLCFRSFVWSSFLGVCPAGRAVGDVPTSSDTAHAWAECSNRGNCNRQTGTCNCTVPFAGSACERSKRILVFLEFCSFFALFHVASFIVHFVFLSEMSW